VNRAEEFVYNLCRNSFFSLWSYSNPRGKNSKELCDILVVFEPHIIIFSVKERRIQVTRNFKIEFQRWIRRVIEKSFRQIYGAERWIRSHPIVIRKNGTPGVSIPKEEIQIHRVIVVLGSGNKLPIFSGDFGRGFVHIFDEKYFEITMNELDTISDFINYLIAIEELITSDKRITIEGGGENLLAFYLYNGRKFPKDYDNYNIQNGLWNEFIKKEEYKRKKNADIISYLWDSIINKLCESLETKYEFGQNLSSYELAIRTLAKEDRFSRRIISKPLRTFIENREIRARMIKAPSGIVYVFFRILNKKDKTLEFKEFKLRCFIARGMNRDCKIVVGIGFKELENCLNFSLIVYYLCIPKWEDRHQKVFENIQENLNFFSKKSEKIVEDEYPKKIY